MKANWLFDTAAQVRPRLWRFWFFCAGHLR
jgi:hypothetical protein